MDLSALDRIFRPPAPEPDGPQDASEAASPADDTGALPAWLEAREERAAILEFDAGLTREEADTEAARLYAGSGADGA